MKIGHTLKAHTVALLLTITFGQTVTVTALGAGSSQGYAQFHIKYVYEGKLRELKKTVPCGSNLINDQYFLWKPKDMYFDYLFLDAHGVQVDAGSFLKTCPLKTVDSASAYDPLHENYNPDFRGLSFTIVDNIREPKKILKFRDRSNVDEAKVRLEYFRIETISETVDKPAKPWTAYVSGSLLPLQMVYPAVAGEKQHEKRALRRACAFIVERDKWEEIPRLKSLLPSIAASGVLSAEDELFKDLYDSEALQTKPDWQHPTTTSRGPEGVYSPWDVARGYSSCFVLRDGVWEKPSKEYPRELYYFGSKRHKEYLLLTASSNDPIITNRFSDPFRYVRLSGSVHDLQANPEGQSAEHVWFYDVTSQTLYWFGDYLHVEGWND